MSVSLSHNSASPPPTFPSSSSSSSVVSTSLTSSSPASSAASSSRRVLVSYRGAMVADCWLASPPSMATLRSALAPLLERDASPSSVHVGYLDEEGDYVRMSTDVELAQRVHEVEAAGTQGTVARLELRDVDGVERGDDDGEDDTDGSFVRVDEFDFTSEPVSPATPASPTQQNRVDSGDGKSEVTALPDPLSSSSSSSSGPAVLRAEAANAAEEALPSATAVVNTSLVLERGGAGEAGVPPSSPSPVAAGRPVAAPAPIAKPLLDGLGAAAQTATAAVDAAIAALLQRRLSRVIMALAHRRLRRLTTRRVLKRTFRWACVAGLLWLALSSFAAVKHAQSSSSNSSSSAVEHVLKGQQELSNTWSRLYRSAERRLVHLEDADLARADGERALEARLYGMESADSAWQQQFGSLLQQLTDDQRDLRALVEQQQRSIAQLQDDLRLAKSAIARTQLDSAAEEARERQKAREKHWTVWPSDNDRSGGAYWTEKAAAASERAERAQRREKEREQRLAGALFPLGEDPRREVEQLYGGALSALTHPYRSIRQNAVAQSYAGPEGAHAHAGNSWSSSTSSSSSSSSSATDSSSSSPSSAERRSPARAGCAGKAHGSGRDRIAEEVRGEPEAVRERGSEHTKAHAAKVGKVGRKIGKGSVYTAHTASAAAPRRRSNAPRLLTLTVVLVSCTQSQYATPGRVPSLLMALTGAFARPRSAHRRLWPPRAMCSMCVCCPVRHPSHPSRTSRSETPPAARAGLLLLLSEAQANAPLTSNGSSLTLCLAGPTVCGVPGR